MDFFKLPAWVKPSAAIIVNVAVVLSVLQPILLLPIPAHAASPIFSDGFEINPPFNQWTSVDSKWNINSSELHAGSKSADVKGDTGSDDDILSKSISTVGYENIILSYWYKAHSLDITNNDKVVVQYSNDSGSNWIDLFQMDSTNDDDQWHQNTHNLPVSSENNSNFSFRFKARLDSAPNDQVWLDDVSLTGDEVQVVVPPTTGGIHGWKYKDANGNGQIDEGEERLGGWTIKLFQGNTLIDTQVTAWDGIYNFEGVAPGLYKVCEEMQNTGTGWLQTQPGPGTSCENDTNGYSVSVEAGVDVYSIDFGNAPGALILGAKYKDLNVNGARDEGEPGIPGWTINLYQDGQLIDSTQTEDNGQGTFSFLGLAAGTYLVCEDLPDNEQHWQQTDPTEAGGSSWRAEGRAECSNGTWGYETTLSTGEEAYGFDFGNINGGLLAGWKYEDINNNGERDEDEPGVPNWTINLYQDDQLVASTQTEDNGKGTYFFLGLPAGIYKVCEEAGGEDWYQTDPAEGHGSTWRADVRVFCETEGTWGFLDEVGLGREEYSFDFGNNRYAAVRVEKIANPNQGHFEFNLTGPDGYDETLATEGSTPEGSPLEFLKLLPGAYSLSEILPEGWEGEQSSQCTDGSQTVVEPGSITLTSGLQVHCVYNNSEYGVITGRKFADDNANSVSNEGEAGLAGWQISLFEEVEVPAEGENATSTVWTSIDTATTDDDGYYTFGNLQPNTYRVCEENRAGWTQSLPGAGLTCDNGTNGYELVITAGSHINTRDFGNWQPGQITGAKWNDANGNGLWDEDETGLNGWVIYVDLNQNGTKDNDEPSAITAGEGSYFLSSLTPGVLQVREVAQGEWVQTYPTSTPYHAVILPSGGSKSDKNFGNHEGEVIPADTEPPVTTITSPNPDTEWEEQIHITGQTTDNVGVAFTVISTALYNGETCGDYATTTTLNNGGGSAIFDWLYDWVPGEDGDYCIQANGTDTSGNVEHTATVFPVKFKKAATPPPTDDNNDDDETSFGGGGGGGGSTSGVGPSSLIAFGSTTTNNGTGGNTDEGDNGNGSGNLGGLLGQITKTAPTNFGGTTTDEEGGNLAGDTGTTTATSSAVAGSSLLAGLGGLSAPWWWLIIILIILAGLGGYWYWKKNEDNQY